MNLLQGIQKTKFENCGYGNDGDDDCKCYIKLIRPQAG